MVHDMNKKIYFLPLTIFFSLSDGSLLSETEKLFFVVDRVKNKLRRFFMTIHVSMYIPTCIGNLISGHNALCVIKKREFLGTRA
jgi:hypothetical protein